MSRCSNHHVILTDSKVCIDNAKATAEVFFNAHLTEIFWGALLLIALFTWIANRKPNHRPVRDDNINYHLQNLNNK